MRSGKVMPPILVKGEWLMRSHHVSDLLLLELCYADTPWSELSPQPHIYQSGHICNTLGCKTPQVLSSQLLYGSIGEFFSKLTTLSFLQVFPHANVVKKVKKKCVLMLFLSFIGNSHTREKMVLSLILASC